MFMVIRTDDNGNNFLILENLNEIDADACVESYKGHKQFYSKLEYLDRKILIEKHKIIE